MRLFILTLISFLFSFNTLASSCCGGGSSGNSVILGDLRYRLNLSYINKGYTEDIDTTGQSTKRSDNNEVEELVNLNGRYQSDNYWQVGIGLGAKMITKESSSSKASDKGLAFLNLSSSYEYFPEKYYSLYIPRGFISLAVELPLANNKYSSSTTSFTDALSRANTAITLGHDFYKQVNQFDILFSLATSFFFDSSQNVGRVSKDNDWLIGLKTSYSINENLSVSVGQNSRLVGSGQILGTDNNSQIPKSRIFETSMGLSLLQNNFIYSLNYTDETLIGKPLNSALGRSVGLSFTFVESL